MNDWADDPGNYAADTTRSEAMAGHKFDLGDRVEKAIGYRFPGIVIGVAKKLDGDTLYVVECTADGVQGMAHIYRAKQLRHAKEAER